MENNENTAPDFFGMPDEEVMGMMPPAAAPAPVVVDPPAEDPPLVDPAPAEVVDPVDPPADPVEPVEPVEPGKVAPVDPAKPAAAAPAEAVNPPGSAEGTPPKEKEAEAAPAAAVVDYEAGYKKLMAPFKANGREISLESPDEAVKLMQMGANYTKKMQALQPALRVVKMLENNQLMDEAQLSYLIDLHQRKPEAIQKLLADSKFDPLSADEAKAAEYVPGDHRVSENEVQFQTVLEDVESTPTGPELIAEVAKQWDADSRQALFRDPRLLTEINSQKASGLYDRISTEVQRRRVLGDLQGVPFLAAYEAVGKDLQAKGLLVPEAAAPVRQDPPVTRVVAPAPAVANSERARAAAPAKVVPATAREEFNPLAQSDEDFLKSMQGRL